MDVDEMFAIVESSLLNEWQHLPPSPDSDRVLEMIKASLASAKAQIDETLA